MESGKDVKLYLAGHEVFLIDAMEYAETQRRLCRQYGFIGLHPMDNNVDVSDSSYKTAVKIYRGNVNQIYACDIVVANCNPFRGVLMDDGTAYELGFGNALGKPSYGYVRSERSCKERMIGRDLAFLSEDLNLYIDSQHYLIVDEFGALINLMMQCGMTRHGGRLVVGSFEDCLKAIRDDITNGFFWISG